MVARMLCVVQEPVGSAAVKFADAVGADTVGEVESQLRVQENFGALPSVFVIPHFFAIGADGNVALFRFVFGEQGEEFLDGFFVLAGLGFG